MRTVEDQLIGHALGIEWTALSPAAQRAARYFLHDTICVGVAGRHAANADRVWQAAQGWGGGASRVLGRPGPGLSAPYAAFVNAFQIHAQEFDCVHEGAVAHPLATVVAALIAEAGRSGPYFGADFLAALAAGVDIVAALGLAATTPLKFFRPATCGIFGSVAALARLRRLDHDVARDAFGHALGQAAGTMQAHVEGKPVLALQVAGAARSAVEAIDLANAGIAAPAHAIDGPFGFLRLFEDDCDIAPLLATLGARERIVELSWKPFPTGRAAHGAIVAVQALRGAGVSEDTLDRLTYHAPPLIARLVGRRPVAAMTASYARLCLPFLAAVTIRRGTVTLDDFSDAALADPATLALADRIAVAVDGNPDPAAFVPAIAEAVLRDGGTARHAVAAHYGSPVWPLSDADHFAKAAACLTFGGLSGAAVALSAIPEHFDRAPDALALIAPAFGFAHDADSD